MGCGRTRREAEGRAGTGLGARGGRARRRGGGGPAGRAVCRGEAVALAWWVRAVVVACAFSGATGRRGPEAVGLSPLACLLAAEKEEELACRTVAKDGGWIGFWRGGDHRRRTVSSLKSQVNPYVSDAERIRIAASGLVPGAH
jgi:hypothetical protein